MCKEDVLSYDLQGDEMLTSNSYILGENREFMSDELVPKTLISDFAFLC